MLCVSGKNGLWAVADSGNNCVVIISKWQKLMVLVLSMVEHQKQIIASMWLIMIAKE